MQEDEITEWVAGAERQLLRTAYLLTGDLQRAEDLVQEAVTKVAVRWRRLRDGYPTAYARRVITRDHISWWRRQRHETPTADVRIDHGVSSDPDTGIVVRRALARLTPAQRAVLVLRHFDDLPGLSTVLDRATDRIEVRGLARTAIANAQRRRITVAVLASVGAVAAATGPVAALVAIPADRADSPPPATQTPTGQTPTSTGTHTPDLEPPMIRPGAVKRRWDPFTVVTGDAGASNLPQTLSPPSSASSVAESPMNGAILAWPEEGHDLRLLGTDGDWRSVPGTADAVTWGFSDTVRPALTPDGQRVAMATDDGVLVVDLTTGDEQMLRWPAH